MITNIAFTIISIYCLFVIWLIIGDKITININIEVKKVSPNSSQRQHPNKDIEVEADTLMGSSNWQRIVPPPPSKETVESKESQQPPPPKEKKSAQVLEDQLDKTFTHNEFTPNGDIDDSDLTQEDLEDEFESVARRGLDPEQQAQGVSFGEINEAVNIAKQRNATHSERLKSANTFAKIEDSDLDSQIRGGYKEMNMFISKLLNERTAYYNKQQRKGVEIENPAGFENFNISDIV